MKLQFFRGVLVLKIARNLRGQIGSLGLIFLNEIKNHFLSEDLVTCFWQRMFPNKTSSSDTFAEQVSFGKRFFEVTFQQENI